MMKPDGKSWQPKSKMIISDVRLFSRNLPILFRDGRRYNDGRHYAIFKSLLYSFIGKALAEGNKRTQSKDIKTAQRLSKEL
jgi:hypothetical protein